MPQKPGVRQRKATVVELDAFRGRGALPPGWTRAKPTTPTPRPIVNAHGRVVGYTDPIGRGVDPNATGPIAPRYIVGNLKGVECACLDTGRLGGLGAESAGGVTISPELIVAEVQKLATAYDAAKPTVSFSRWAADQGAGALVDEFKAMLRAAGDAETLAYLDATPELPPEAKIAAFDAPAGPGPWALDANGNWFRVTVQAPGSEVLQVDGREIYVPAEHPSTHVKENAYGTGEAHRKRWTEQKFRAANKALLGADPFYNLFFRVAPRGGWGGGQGFGREFEGTANDYTHEGGELYPGLEGGAEAQALADWYGRNSFDARFGYDRGLTLNWLRVYTDAEGYRRYKAWSDAELMEYGRKWHMASPGYVCGGDEVIGIGNGGIAKQRERQGGQPEGDYSVHWPWIIGPLSQCSPTSSSRRRKNLKKAAAVAAIVVGAIFLGPMIAGAFKAVMAKGAIAGKLAAGAKAAKLAKIASTAAKVIPKVVTGINTAQTIKAIKDGEVPPPPISITGTRFVDYASAIGTNLVERELQEQGEQVAESERALLEQRMRDQVSLLQRQAISELPVPPSRVPMYALPGAQASVAAGAGASSDTLKLAAIGAAVLGVLLLSRSR